MNTLKNLQALVKSKIQITTSEGDYEGVVRLVCPVTRKLILEKLIFLPKCLFMGALQFHVDEILSFKLVSEPQSTSNVKFQDKQIVSNTASENYNLDLPNCLPKEDTYVSNFPQYSHLKLPTKSVILDYIGKEFHQTIALIQKLDSIGVSLNGPSIGRDGILSWVSIATPSCIFHFDIQNLKNKAFRTEGLLRDIFENPRIEKILHDCRNASDCLYHQFNTKLVNVFDTQVADLIVALQVNYKGTLPQKVNTLNFCINKYLNVSNNFLPKEKQGSYINEVIYYQVRPLQNETRNQLIRNVIYLRALKQRLYVLLLNPFYRAVNVYLQVVQSATDRELLLEPPSEDEVPLQLIMEGLQTVRFRDQVPLSSVASREFDVGNAVESYANLCKSNKYNVGNNSIKNYYGSQNVSKLDHKNIFDQGATARSDGYIRDEGFLNGTITSRQSESKNDDKLNSHSFGKTSTKSQSMNCGQVINNTESHDKSLHLKNREKFRLSRQKFHNLNSHDLEHVNNTDNGQTVAASSIESIFTNKDILNEKEKLQSPEDPYAKLRAAFINAYDTDDKDKRKLKFIPAGMC